MHKQVSDTESEKKLLQNFRSAAASFALVGLQGLEPRTNRL